MKKIALILCAAFLLEGCVDDNVSKSSLPEAAKEATSITVSPTTEEVTEPTTKDKIKSEAAALNFTVSGAEVKVSDSEGVIQTLECDYTADTDKIITEDYDFDGFDDLFVSMEHGAMFAPGTYFRFVPEIGLYEKWDKLNETGCEMIADPEAKTLTLRNNSSEYWLEYFIYKWENGELVLCEHDVSETGEKMLVYSVDSDGNETLEQELVQ